MKTDNIGPKAIEKSIAQANGDTSSPSSAHSPCERVIICTCDEQQMTVDKNEIMVVTLSWRDLSHPACNKQLPFIYL